jgi:uncharacterized protein (TIGR02266 family)
MSEPGDVPKPAEPTPIDLAAPAAPTPAEEEAGARAENKRRHQRTALSLLVQFRFNTFEDFLAEYSIDISVGGMFIRTDHPRPEGSMIYLQFALRDGHKLIEGLGKVVRVNPPGGTTIPGMGVEFVNLDSESEGLIAEIVDTKHQRTHPAT